MIAWIVRECGTKVQSLKLEENLHLKVKMKKNWRSFTLDIDIMVSNLGLKQMMKAVYIAAGVINTTHGSL